MQTEVYVSNGDLFALLLVVTNGLTIPNKKETHTPLLVTRELVLMLIWLILMGNGTYAI